VNEVNTKEVEKRTKLLSRLITVRVGRFLPGEFPDFPPATVLYFKMYVQQCTACAFIYCTAVCSSTTIFCLVPMSTSMITLDLGAVKVKERKPPSHQ
jgi:hypothetical protein